MKIEFMKIERMRERERGREKEGKRVFRSGVLCR